MRENQLLDADRTTLDFVLHAKSRGDGDTPTIVSVTTGRDGAAGAASHVAARRVAAAGDGRRELRRLGERLVAVGARASTTRSCSTRPSAR